MPCGVLLLGCAHHYPTDPGDHLGVQKAVADGQVGRTAESDRLKCYATLEMVWKGNPPSAAKMAAYDEVFEYSGHFVRRSKTLDTDDWKLIGTLAFGIRDVDILYVQIHQSCSNSYDLVQRYANAIEASLLDTSILQSLRLVELSEKVEGFE